MGHEALYSPEGWCTPTFRAAKNTSKGSGMRVSWSLVHMNMTLEQKLPTIIDAVVIEDPLVATLLAFGIFGHTPFKHAFGTFPVQVGVIH